MNNGFSVKCWQKVCTKLCKWESPASLLFNGKKKQLIYSSSGESIKIGNVGGIDMIIANILTSKKNEKVEGMDIIITNIYISLEKNHGFSVKCWQNICTKFCKLSLKIAFFQHFIENEEWFLVNVGKRYAPNCTNWVWKLNFFSFGEGTPPHIRHPIFNGQRFIKVLTKASKQERREELET